MAEITSKISVKVAWWVRWYVPAVVWFSLLTGRQPDMDKLSQAIGRALSLCVRVK